MSDPRFEAYFRAFTSPQAPDVFRSVLSTDDVWRPDPLDVPEIHAKAREVFNGVVQRTAAASAADVDRLILIEGASGTGKTHLMGSLRNQLHESGRGFFTYMQMQTGISNYASYMLRNIVESLDRPMRVDYSPERGLDYLARSIVQLADVDGSDDDAFDPIQVATRVVDSSKFTVDREFLAALATIALHKPSFTASAIKFLGGQELAPFERNELGGGYAQRTDAVAMIKLFSRTIAQCFGVPLVICLDQLDDFYASDPKIGAQRFESALQAINPILQDSNIIIIIAVLDDQYAVMSPGIAQTYRDRLELGTRPIKLDQQTPAATIRAVLEKRLAYLYEVADLDVTRIPSLFPFPADTPDLLAGARLRTVLNRLQTARLTSVLTGNVPAIEGSTAVEIETPPATLLLSEQWNDARLSYAFEFPKRPEPLVELLEFALARISDEMPPQWTARLVDDATGTKLERLRAGAVAREYFSIANHAPQGGTLGKAVERIAQEAEALKLSAVIVRSGDYPTNPRSQVTKILGQFLANGNRRVSIGPSEWSALAAFREFHGEHVGNADYRAWQAATKPLSSLPGLQTLLQFDEALPAIPASLAVEQLEELSVSVLGVPLGGPKPLEAPAFATPIELGRASDGTRVSLDAATLVRHAAVLGGSGSGKTTLAFRLLEGLAVRGIPSILIDRKGDLCSLADPEAWTRDVDEETARRRDLLRRCVDVRLYTPGARAGRNLGISALPSALSSLPLDEIDEAARAAAVGLGAMLEYGPARKDRLAVLDRAIATLGSIDDAPLTIDTLAAFIARQDPLLLAAIGSLKPKVLDAVANDLSVLRINASRLLATDGEIVDIERLFGMDEPEHGRTRISVISMKGLGEGVDSLFWISRLLVELSRFGSRRPRAGLQAVVFFDEADRYLPATSKPITKEPMENLLKRARSAGLGIILATQSPGDLDYKSKENITTWLVGRVSQERAIQKLDDVLGSAAAQSLPGLTVGQFYLAGHDATRLFTGDLPVIMPNQLEEAKIVELAAGLK